jgi:SAM-dependent methyltransferase
LCDINPRHVELVRNLFGGVIHALHNQTVPHLPFPDGFFDCVTAYSVFTHIYDDDTAWLLELRRIIRPGGALYITLHDQETWRQLPTVYHSDLFFADEQFRQYYAEHPQLEGRVGHFYSDSDAYNCNVFVTSEYVQQFWAPLFASCDIQSAAHGYQAAAALRTPDD